MKLLNETINANQLIMQFKSYKWIRIYSWQNETTKTKKNNNNNRNSLRWINDVNEKKDEVGGKRKQHHFELNCNHFEWFWYFKSIFIYLSSTRVFSFNNNELCISIAMKSFKRKTKTNYANRYFYHTNAHIYSIHGINEQNIFHLGFH